MILRISWGKVKPGTWPAFEEAYVQATGGWEIDGLEGRWLCRDQADPDAGFTISLWKSPEDLATYEGGEAFKDLSKRLEPFFIGEYKTYKCEVRHSS